MTTLAQWPDEYGKSFPILGNILAVSGAILVVAWIRRFIGHRIESKPPLFFKDVQFLPIGPASTLAALFRALGAHY